MRAALLLLLAACSLPFDDPPDSEPDGPPDPGPDTPDDDWVPEPFDRTVNRVLVDGDFIYWTHGRFECPIEYPCSLEGPSVTEWSRATQQVRTRYAGGLGARSIVGTADTRFFVAMPDYFGLMQLMRDRDAPVALHTSPAVLGPALDATYVYWADATDSPSDVTLRRATRTGDGSDATVLATRLPMSGTSELVHAAGYLWWLADRRLYRLRDDGRNPATVVSGLPPYPEVITARGDTIYVASTIDGIAGDRLAEIGRVTADGTYTLIARHSSSPVRWPHLLVATADALYWSLRDGNVYRAPITGGAVETIAAGDRAGYAFAVLPDRILVEFTARGFRELPR